MLFALFLGRILGKGYALSRKSLLQKSGQWQICEGKRFLPSLLVKFLFMRRWSRRKLCNNADNSIWCTNWLYLRLYTKPLTMTTLSLNKKLHGEVGKRTVAKNNEVTVSSCGSQDQWKVLRNVTKPSWWALLFDLKEVVSYSLQ